MLYAVCCMLYAGKEDAGSRYRVEEYGSMENKASSPTF